MAVKECVLCTKRTLYECNHAKVHNARIYCDRGHKLSKISRDGNLGIYLLAIGMPLALAFARTVLTSTAWELPYRTMKRDS